jgi:hypothetical protein
MNIQSLMWLHKSVYEHIIIIIIIIIIYDLKIYIGF